MSLCVECNSIFQKAFLMWHLGAKQFKCHTYRSLLADNINYNDNLLQLNNRKRFNFGNVIIKLEHVIFEKIIIFICAIKFHPNNKKMFKKLKMGEQA